MGKQGTGGREGERAGTASLRPLFSERGVLEPERASTRLQEADRLPQDLVRWAVEGSGTEWPRRLRGRMCARRQHWKLAWPEVEKNPLTWRDTICASPSPLGTRGLGRGKQRVRETALRCCGPVPLAYTGALGWSCLPMFGRTRCGDPLPHSLYWRGAGVGGAQYSGKRF